MKEKKAGKNESTKTEGLAVAYTTALIVVAVAVLIISSFILPSVQMMGMRENETHPEFVGMGGMNPQLVNLNGYLTIRLLLSILNAVLVAYLLFVYVRSYLVLKSNFTLGIVAFLFSFFLYALSSIPLVHGLFSPFGIGGVFSFVPMLFSAIGLLIFAKLSNE
jgi:hypothetical protein